ncbi:SHOCT domain-containing protein [Halodesulfurarchaeum sp.]|uniref:SHOCT domain-containing protein n=1 Tax=Halodesulfurarchaeum sp. TaxID=1980530 RepID=UPI001BBC77EC|nr:SHOCT domain-containing protein [Halodesulfurarchaeum sp.]
MVLHSTPFLFAPIGFLLIALFFGALGYMVFKRTNRSSTDASENGVDRALETLRQRYATGEIDAEEYQERKELLRR